MNVNLCICFVCAFVIVIATYFNMYQGMYVLYVKSNNFPVGKVRTVLKP